MSRINTMDVAFYMSAALISITCIVYTLMRRRMWKPQNKTYLGMLLALMLNAAAETVYAMIMPFGTDSAFVHSVMVLCDYLYFVFHTALLPMLGYYIMCVTGLDRKLNRKRLLLFLLPFFLTELLMLSNPLNHWSYFYDSGMNFIRNWGELVLYVASLLYFLFVIATFFRSWRVVFPKRRYALAYFLFLTLAGILIQYLFIDLQVELFAESMAFLGLMLTVENEDDLLDGDTGIYNRRALRLDVENLLANRLSFHALCVKIENADLIQRLTGSTNPALLSALLAKGFARFVPLYQVYQTSPDTFILTLMEEDRERGREFAERICARFQESWTFEHTEVLFKPSVVLALVPEDMKNAEDLFNLADTPVPPELHKSLLYGDDLGYLFRRRAVENAIQRGLREGGFQVYYQPTYSMETLRAYGAEALVRLRDETLGDILPEEFIPIAEQLGLIGEVDDFVLKTVCRFLASGIPERLGLEYINVNLSVLQCLQPGFGEHILSLAGEEAAVRSHLNFEITESVGAEDYDTLGVVIRQLRKAGFRTYMDDYGTGYSNLQAIFSMDFDVIKIDKSLLRGAQRSKLGMTILENSVRMIREMGREILVEGVETAEQISLLERLGVDYLQGYYFSRPISQDELIKLLLMKA